MLTKVKRIFDDSYYGGSRVSFDGWHGLNEFEKLAAKSFEDGIESTLESIPPDVSIQPNEANDDLIVTLNVRGLGNGDDGPTWQFSAKEEFINFLSDCYEEDKLATLESLLALAEVVRAMIDNEELLHEREAACRAIRSGAASTGSTTTTPEEDEYGKP
jgi:hypothetical protein